MTLGLCFWIIMVIWLVFGALLHFGYVAGAYGAADVLLLFVLFALLGWQVFGAPLHKG